MAPSNLPYTTVRKGRYWYFRHSVFPKLIPLPGQPDDAEFFRAYLDLLDRVKFEQSKAEQRADARSVCWLAERYEASDEFRQLKEKTRKSYSRELNRLKNMAGDLPYSEISKQGARAMRKRVKADVVADREQAIAKREASDAALKKLGKKPKRGQPAPVTEKTGARTADLFNSVLSALLTWAEEEELIDENPLEGMKRLHRKPNVESYVPWTEEQIEHVLAEAPQWIADGVTLGLYTGQRLIDCVKMGKQHCVLPIMRVRQKKTGTLVDVHAPSPVVELVKRRKRQGGPENALLLRKDGKPYTQRLFSEHLRVFLDSLGYEELSFHGLRYSAAGTLSEAGCSVAVIVSIIGHRTYEMAMKYLRAREDSAIAAKAMEEASANRAVNIANRREKSTDFQ